MDHNEAENGECFCELCSLDFTTPRELEEHTWSMLHNTNLNRKQGRDCVHPCSLCKEQFIGLLEFTTHLHSDNHQEKIHQRKQEQQEWSPDKQEQHSPDEQLQSPDNKEEEDRPPSDWTTDDLSGVREFQDYSSEQGGEPVMGDNRWGSGLGRGSSRGKPSLLGDPPPVRYHYQEPPDMRRGMPPDQSWADNRWEANGDYFDRDYPNEGPLMRDGGPREPQRVFRNGPWYNPAWAGVNDPRNSNRWPDERPHGNTDRERYSYPNDNFSDNYGPGPWRRGSFEGDSEMGPWNNGQRPDLRERITRRNDKSSHTSYNGQREMKSVVGSSFLSSRETEGRPNSRSRRRKGRPNNSRGSTPFDKRDQGRRTSQETNKKDFEEKSQQKASPSSASPSGKSGRKSSKPRKVTRSEDKKDASTDKDTSERSNELRKKEKDETAVTDKEKNGTKSTSPSTSKPIDGGEKNIFTIKKLNMEPSESLKETSKKPLVKRNSSSSSNGDPPSSKKDSFSKSKGGASSSVKGDSPKSSKVNSSSSPKQNTPSWLKGLKGSASSAKGDSSLSAKGDSASTSKGISFSSAEGDSPKSSKVNSSSSSKQNTSSSTTKGSPSWAKEDSLSSAKGDSFSTFTGDSSLPVKAKTTSTTNAGSPSATKEDFSSLAKGDSSSLTKEDASSVAKKFSSSPNKKVSTNSLEIGGGSLISVKEKEDPEKAANKQKDSSSSIKDKDKSTDSSKKEGETSLNTRNNLSQNSKKAVNLMPVLSGEKKDVSVPKVGEVSLLSTRAKNDQDTSAPSFSKNTNSSVPVNEKERTVDNQPPSISSKSKENKSMTTSSVTSSVVGSLPWGQREEKLRALLGIKKEPKNDEDQQGSAPCTMSKSNKVALESQTNRAVSSSSSISAVSSLPSGSNKPTTSKYVPVISQLSLSRPQCSFVHIDGVQCGAITWNKYCSYHQRVFQSEESNTHETTDPVSEENQLSRNESIESSDLPKRTVRQGGTQIFRPTTPPYDPPKRFGVDGKADVISGVKADHGLGSRDRKQEVEGENGKDHKEHSKDIDLSSTVPYTALGAAGAPKRNIDLSTTVRGATRSFLLHGPSTDVRSGPSIDLSSTVPKPGGTSRSHSTAVNSTNSTETGIDLSGTVPDLEGLLALHNSSADKETGPKFDSSKTLLKPERSWNQQSSLADSGPQIDLSETVPYRGGARYLDSSSVGSDEGPSIDLNDTVAQPGRSVTPLDGTGFANTVGQAAASSFTSHSKSEVGHDVPQKHSAKSIPDRESTSSSPAAKIKTEMIDLNFSTKLLGVPHSVVTPFNTSIPSPKKPTREMTKSPSEFSTRSSISPSPRNYAPQSPQTRRVSTSPMTGEQSPSSTISLSNLSLDLSRFNLPPAVRKALAERYSGKKVPSATSGQPPDFPDGRRSQPLFTEHHATTEGHVEHGKKLSPLPARLRGRGQRSISLDSPIARRDNLHGEGSSRSLLLERGNIYDTNRFLRRPFSGEGHNQTGMSASDRNPEGLFAGSNNVPTPSVSSTNDPIHGISNELQSRGLIDLSSTSYLQGISLPLTNQGQSTEATRPTIDNSRTPVRPLVLQSQGLIDLNTTSPDFGARNAPVESPEALSVIKRKRVNSLEGSETTSNLGAEKVVKRLKQEEANAQEEPISYRPGINVQQLLTIEREEQEQLQNLHTVQSSLKSVRAQIQKLCTELDSLSSEEQRITLKMDELRNMRLSILQNACYERQGQVTRVETVTRESSTSTVDDMNKTFPASGGSEKGDSLEYEKTKVENYFSDSTRLSNPLDDTSRSTATYDYHANDIEDEKMSTEVGMDESMTSQGEVCSTEELNTSKSTDDPVVPRVSVGTATKFVLKGDSRRSTQPRENVQEKLNVASKRSSNWRQSSNEVDFNRGVKNVAQTSRAQISEKATYKELAERIPASHQDSDPSSFDGGSERGSVIAPVCCGGAGTQRQNEPIKGNETRRNLMKKMKQIHSADKVPFRKKSVSDVNVSKTLEAGRKKIQSVKENMKRWKEQDLAGGMRESNDNQKRKHSSPSSIEVFEDPPESSVLDESGSSPITVSVRDKTSTRKTTRELKKSSLFHSSKKSSKEARKNKVDKTNWKDKEKSRQTEAVPAKRRKIDDTSCSASSKEKTSSQGMGQIVSAAAHTTTIDIGGSGAEDRSSTEDEIPTRDVDSQPRATSSNVSHLASHLQIPSSTVESLKNSLQNSKGGRRHRGALPTTFAGHTGAVCGLKVHNGQLFTCSADKTTRSFNIQTGQCVKVYQGHHLAVNCIEIAADKDRLFTGSNDQHVRSYNIKSGVCTHKFTHDGRVMCIHYAFDRLFVGLSTGIVALIDVVNNTCLERLHCHEPRGVSCLTTATEGQRKLLCSGSFDSTIAIRDCKSGLLLRTFTDHNMTVLCLQVVENILYSGSADMKVQAHNLNSGELLRSFEGHTMSVSGLQVVGSVLVTSCLDKLIRCYDLVTADLLQVYGGQMDMIFSVHVNSERIYSGARDGSVVASKLDLQVYHPCKWRECQLNFGVVAHLKNHLREYHVIEQGTVEACHWADCGLQFSADDEISVVLKHVLGHVVTRTARKSAS